MYQIFLPHPNPPLIKGREPDFLVSPLYKGGLRGVIIRLKSQPNTFPTSSHIIVNFYTIDHVVLRVKSYFVVK
jgi:hypothetical protein